MPIPGLVGAGRASAAPASAPASATAGATGVKPTGVKLGLADSDDDDEDCPPGARGGERMLLTTSEVYRRLFPLKLYTTAFFPINMN